MAEHTRQIRPPGNQNAFRHGLGGIAQRRSDGVVNPTEHSIREELRFIPRQTKDNVALESIQEKRCESDRGAPLRYRINLKENTIQS
jgi:hypothetical protein